MYCKYCGKPIKDNNRFCPFCGKNLIDFTVNCENKDDKQDMSAAEFSDLNVTDFNAEELKEKKLSDCDVEDVSTSASLALKYNYKRIIQIVILAFLAILVVKTIFGNTNGNALVGTWRLTTVSSSRGSKNYSSYGYRIAFYKSGTFNDINQLLEEDLDSDGNINSWKVESAGTLTLKDRYGSTFVVKYTVFLGTLTLKYDGQTSTYRRTSL